MKPPSNTPLQDFSLVGNKVSALEEAALSFMLQKHKKNSSNYKNSNSRHSSFPLLVNRNNILLSYFTELVV